MIKALIEIGRSLRDVYPMPLVEIPYSPQSGKKEPKVLVVDLITDAKGVLKISNLYISDYSHEDARKKYFFRSGKSQGAAPSLSFKLPGSPRTLRQRLDVLKNLGYQADREDIAKVIESAIAKFKNEGKIGKSVLIILKIDGKWPAENEKLRENFVNEFLNKLGDNNFRRFWRVKNICHGCGEEKLVYGGVGDLLKFYTVDKYGYAPELNPRIAWKQYALCEECIFDFERGKRAKDDFLKWRFYGKEFWLLPVSTGNLKKVLDRFRNFHVELSGKAQEEGYESLEDRLLYEASLQEEAVSYHFVFVQKDNQALRIKLHIEEVLPSVLKEYVRMKKELKDEFNDFVSEAFLTSGFNFNFFSSKNLKATNQKPGFTDEDFYMLVDKVFRRSPVDERYLISKAMSRITKDMAEAGEQGRIPWWSVLETLLSLEFLLKWGILKRKIGGINMSGLPYEEFFATHGDFFNHPAKRGLVLLGVLVQRFLNEQYKRRQSTPFLKVLKNLRLDQKDVQKIYVALQNKMNEYEIGHWWSQLREGASIYFIKAGDKWQLSPDEIGFYIAIGMALHSHPIFGGNKSEGEKSENE